MRLCRYNDKRASSISNFVIYLTIIKFYWFLVTTLIFYNHMSLPSLYKVKPLKNEQIETFNL